jgi:hypothetical protein
MESIPIAKRSFRMLKGSCLCKGIQFEITGPHSRIHHCHCSLCRKTTGGGPSAEITCTKDGFRWISGRDLVIDGPKHAFCRVCGVHAPYPHGTQVSVPVGSLDDNPALVVGQHIFVGSRARWEAIGPDGAPRFELHGSHLPLDQQA